MDEVDLIKVAQTGELQAFNQLILNYQGLAFNVATRILNDTEAAADVTQESFIKAFKAWLLCIVTNTCYDHLRTLQRHRTVSLEESTENPEGSIKLSDRKGSPEEHALRSELREAVQEGIAALPDVQRLAQPIAYSRSDDVVPDMKRPAYQPLLF